MPILYVTTREGRIKTVTVTAQSELSIMEILRDNGFDEVLALCGGSCSCATCHVYVEVGLLSSLAPMNGDESDLLESSSHRKVNSRLSCQIKWSDSMDGSCVEIAPEE